jgi:hypothetical protein
MECWDSCDAQYVDILCINPESAIMYCLHTALAAQEVDTHHG